MRRLLLTGLAMGLLAGCSIQLPRDHDADGPASCSVRCGENAKASASCSSPRIPACACEPTPAASCVGA